MCTVTIIPLDGGPRLAINRDERRTRPPALHPAAVDLESGLRAAWPTDAHAGGTWVALNDRGLALALLNGNPRPMPALPLNLASRGLIIPKIIAHATADDAVEHLHTLHHERFAPFRLVAADASAVLDAVWDRARLTVTRRPLAPVCFVSSGLGDHRAAPRLALFDQWFARRPADPDAQDEFHRHHWPDRPEISVRMAREDARTMSVTVIESARRAMHYEDDAGRATLSLADRHDAPMPTATRGRRAPC